jgi:GNAT superfamily N-acetyltransferase
VSTGLHYSLHDSPLPAAAVAAVDAGLGASNEAAAPLHQVQPLACFVHDTQGKPAGGAVGRTWGECAELQQLWVEPAWRRQGIGAELLRRFEARAAERGCRRVYLETFSFQAPALYRRLGYQTLASISGFAPGTTKFWMLHELV